MLTRHLFRFGLPAILCLLLMVGLTPSLLAEHASDQLNTLELQTLETKLRTTLDDLRQTSGFPGATLAVRLPDGSYCDIAVGFADPDSSAAMQPSDRMFTGSAGKTFVAAVALQLVAAGKLALEDPLAMYFADRPWFAELPNHDRITVYRLMTHTSGLPRYVFKEEFWAAVWEQPDRIWRPEECIAFILGDEPLHEVGAAWSYSDTNFILLGMLIEQLCGATYYDELQRRILDPLELRDTTPSRGRELAGLVAGISGDSPPISVPERVLVDGRYLFDPQWEWTGGGLVTTSHDLAKWAQALYGGEVLAARMTARMKEAVSTETGKRADDGYGLGVQVWTTDWGVAYGHGGIFPGYQTQMEYLPRFGCAMALQINADRMSGRLDKGMHDYLLTLWPVVTEFVRGHLPEYEQRTQMH